MEKTPRANRIHIGIFGRCNSGKSSLVNALVGQQAAIVSDVAGTTTDPVLKSMELPGLGAVTFIDTAGFDDSGALAAERLTQTRNAARRTDLAVVVFSGETGTAEQEWIGFFKEQKTPVVAVLNKADLLTNKASAAAEIEQQTGLRPLLVSTLTGEGVAQLREQLAQAGQSTENEHSITGDLAVKGDVVLLVMPQDAQAPKGRLILPQVQTIRELLDKGCTALCCTPEQLAASLQALAAPPALVITDSQVFGQVHALIASGTPLTSFSVLFAHYKGDIAAFAEGAAAIDRLTEKSRVLIAEACAHAPADEDIGRVKIPRLLRTRVGEKLTIDVVSGDDFPDDLSRYDLVIHCGACLFNRRLVLARIGQAVAQHIPITNYGIALAHLTGILSRIVYPGQRSKP